MKKAKTQPQEKSQQATQTESKAVTSTSCAKQQEPHNEQSALTRHDPVKLPSVPVLRFLPTAWAKLLFFRDRGQTEIGGFGISAADDLLLIEDFVTVKQDVTVASVSFEDDAVADLFDAQVDAGRKPEQFARIWLHSHPGNSPQPSSMDEETFRRVFGSCQWAVMFVVAKGGKSHARLRFNIGPGGQLVIPVDVDYSQPFGPSDRVAWEAEYKANIKTGIWHEAFGSHVDPGLEDLAACSCPDDWLEQLEAMEPQERRLIMDELAARPDLWDETEVDYAY